MSQSVVIRCKCSGFLTKVDDEEANDDAEHDDNNEVNNDDDNNDDDDDDGEDEVGAAGKDEPMEKVRAIQGLPKQRPSPNVL